LEPKLFKDLGAKRIKARYGPFLVPPASDEATGGMKSFAIQADKMPCNDCLITNWQPGFEFRDGSIANADNGMWLHHIVFLNMNRTDTTCDKFPDRFSVVTNERTPVDVTLKGYAWFLLLLLTNDLPT
jgi:hypothetical protein